MLADTSKRPQGQIARACAVKKHLDKSQEPFFAEFTSSTSLYIYRINPAVWTHCLGVKVRRT